MKDAVQSKIAQGLTWAGLEKLAAKAVRFLIGLILARLLVPGDYGLIGMLGIFIGVSSLFVDSGFNAALIQKKDRSEDDFATVFWFNLVVACICYGLLFVVSPLIASFYQQPKLCAICRVIALALPIGALASVPRLRLTVALDFRPQTVITLIALLLSGGVAIALAYAGKGVWALVAQQLVEGGTTALLLWGRTKLRLAGRFSRASFRRFFSYGWKHLCSGLINTIYVNIYSLVIGKAFGPTQIGYYTRADAFAALPGETVTDTVMRVNFPVLAQLQDDRTKLLDAYRRLVRLPLFVLTPMLFGLIATAKPFILLTIGEQWLPCVPFLQVICLGVLFEPLSAINLNLLYVKGRTDCVLKLELMKKPIAFALVLSLVPFGILWMCVGRAVYAFVAFAFNCIYTKKILDYGLLAQMREVIPIFLNGLFMCVLVGWVLRLLPDLPPVVQLLLAVPLGAVSYLSVAVLLRDPSLRFLRDFVRR